MQVWSFLLPILVVDVLNPVLFAFMVYAAGGARPALVSGAMLAGHTVAYLAAGIVIGVSLEQILAYLAEPKPIDFAISGLLGCALLWLALKTRTDKGDRPRESQAALTPGSAFVSGAIINFVGIPFAVPYFAAISQILKLDATFLQALLILVAYNLLYALPFAIVPVSVAVMGERSRPLLEKINGVLDRASGFLMPIILLLVAVALIADAVSYFWSGESLF